MGLKRFQVSLMIKP